MNKKVIPWVVVLCAVVCTLAYTSFSLKGENGGIDYLKTLEANGFKVNIGQFYQEKPLSKNSDLKAVEKQETEIWITEEALNYLRNSSSQTDFVKRLEEVYYYPTYEKSLNYESGQNPVDVLTNAKEVYSAFIEKGSKGLYLTGTAGKSDAKLLLEGDFNEENGLKGVLDIPNEGIEYQVFLRGDLSEEKLELRGTAVIDGKEQPILLYGRRDKKVFEGLIMPDLRLEFTNGGIFG